MTRRAHLVYLCAFAFTLALAVTTAPPARTLDHQSRLDTPGQTGPREHGSGVIRFRSHGAEYWWNETQRLRRQLARQWQPTVAYAARLAEATYGIPAEHLLRVAGCESTGQPGVVYVYADNPTSTALGPLQYLDSTWASTRYAAFQRTDTVAAMLAAARHVAGHRSWSPWTESRPCHGLR